MATILSALTMTTLLLNAMEVKIDLQSEKSTSKYVDACHIRKIDSHAIKMIGDIYCNPETFGLAIYLVYISGT